MRKRIVLFLFLLIFSSYGKENDKLTQQEIIKASEQIQLYFSVKSDKFEFEDIKIENKENEIIGKASMKIYSLPDKKNPITYSIKKEGESYSFKYLSTFYGVELILAENTSFNFYKIFSDYTPNDDEIFNEEEQKEFFNYIPYEDKSYYVVSPGLMCIPDTDIVYFLKISYTVIKENKEYPIFKILNVIIEKNNGFYYAYFNGKLIKKFNSLSESKDLFDLEKIVN